MTQKVGLGGGCHWCTEGIFQSLKGVSRVDQGWIKSSGNHTSYSEAVIVHFNPEVISLEVLIEIHLLTHSSQSQHSLRTKYRSAVYTFGNGQASRIRLIIEQLQKKNRSFVTKVIPFVDFKLNKEEFLNYYQKRKDSPFCEKYISPKLQQLLKTHSQYLK